MGPGRASSRRWLSFGLALAVVSGGAGAADPPPATGSALDRVDRALHSIQGMIRNSGSRLRKGIQGLGGDAAAGATPAMLCCTNNIDRIAEHLEGIKQGLVEFAATELRPDQNEGYAVLPLTKVEFLRLRQEVERFRTATDRRRAEEALERMVPPFNKLRRDVERLRKCCGPPAAPAESPAQ